MSRQKKCLYLFCLATQWLSGEGPAGLVHTFRGVALTLKVKEVVVCKVEKESLGKKLESCHFLCEVDMLVGLSVSKVK